MKTIARNRAKKITAIKAAVTRVSLRTLENGFVGETSTVEAAFAALTDYDFARLRDREDGTYVVEVHSNKWFEIDTRPVTTPEQAAEQAAAVIEQATRVVADAADKAGPVKLPYIPKATVVQTRKAIGTQLAEALDTLGVTYTTGYAGGAGYYEVNGTSYTAGALADLVLEGGFDAAYGRAETIVRQDSPLKPADGPQAAADDMPINTRVVRITDGEPGTVESRYSDGRMAVVMVVDGKTCVDRWETFAPVETWLTWLQHRADVLIDEADRTARDVNAPVAAAEKVLAEAKAAQKRVSDALDRVAAETTAALEARSCSECAEEVGETEIGRNGGTCDDCAVKADEEFRADERIDGDAGVEPVDGIERTPANADGSVTLPPHTFDNPVKTGEEILADESDLGRELAARNAAELTRVERRALRNGVTRPAARPALDGLRLRSLITGGRGDGPVRLTAMGRAVVALLKGAPVPA